MEVIFWNGNKTFARKNYETELLDLCLKAGASGSVSYRLHLDNTDHPQAEAEACVLENGADILVTVAGNKKFSGKQKIVIDQPLAKGLLGFRLLLIRQASHYEFKQIRTPQQLQARTIGIPKTWADADLFRENGYRVLEEGSFDDLFTLLKNRHFDYATLGANEIDATLAQRASETQGIVIAPGLMLYYPFPLVFYVNPNRQELAASVSLGLHRIISNGDFDQLFNKHYGAIVQNLNMRNRKIFELHNPILPGEMADFRSTLMDD